MVDQRIILNFLYNTTIESNVWSSENKRDYTQTKSLIFFPFLKRGYYEKLIGLNPRQYLQRLNILYPVFTRIN